MQVVCIYSGVSAFQQKLDYIFNIFKSTLQEIDVEVNIFDVSKLNIDFFNGTKVPIIETIINNIKNANGIIFATTAQRLAPNGAMQCFLEHMDYNLYGDILKDKSCLSIITSNDNSEYMAGNYMNTLVSSLGGIPVSGMFIGKDYLQNIETSITITQMVEKYAEDFYRCIRQNRKYFVVNPFKAINLSFENKEQNIQQEQNNNINYNFQHTPEPIITEDGKQIRSLSGSQVAGLYEKEVQNNNIINGYENNFNNNINNMPQNNTSQNSIQQNNINVQPNNNMFSNNIQQNNSMSPLNNNIDKVSQEIPKQQKQTINYNNIYGEQANFNSNLLNQPRTYEPSQKSYNIQDFNSVQEDDISELTRLLSQKYKEKEAQNNNSNQFIGNTNKLNNNVYLDNITPSINTLKQKTQSLYHYFQPQLAKGIDLIIQVLISGKENFSGYFTIKDGECTYTEGVNNSPGVSIISDAGVWEEVINGQSTLQKAFMLGRLKVKGNFVMVSKFEQFFKIN